MPRGRPRKNTLPPTSTHNGPKKGKRGRPKKIIIPFDWSDSEPQVEIEVESEEHIRKFERIYEDKFVISTWQYDLDVSERGPIQVDVKYKKNIEEIDWDARAREISNEKVKKIKAPKKRGRPKIYKNAKKN